MALDCLDISIKSVIKIRLKLSFEIISNRFCLTKWTPIAALLNIFATFIYPIVNIKSLDKFPNINIGFTYYFFIPNYSNKSFTSTGLWSEACGSLSTLRSFTSTRSMR